MITVNLQKAKDLKADTIREIANKKLELLNGPYKKHEIETWAIQRNEAIMFLSNRDLSTPMLTAIANARGIEKHELSNKILEKATAFGVAVGTIIGIQQSLLTQIYSVTTLSELTAIEWPE